jgi:hypothetical protein
VLTALERYSNFIADQAAMDRRPSGYFHRTSHVGEVARAFVSHALPLSPRVDLSGERQRLLEKALLACGHLHGLSALLSDRDLFIYSHVRREAVLSSQIEGRVVALTSGAARH